jgi:hypothetical protein
VRDVQHLDHQNEIPMKHLITLLIGCALLQACSTEVQSTPKKDLNQGPSTNTQTQNPVQVTEKSTIPSEISIEGDGINPEGIKGEAPAMHREETVVMTITDACEMRSYADESAGAPSSSRASGGKSSMAGKLTAGEINDFQKWKMWEDLSEMELSAYRGTWQISMQQRYCVMIRNKSGFPVIDAKCTLIDESGAALWTGRSDNTGKAELWASTDVANSSKKAVKIKIETEKKTEWINQPKPFLKGINHIKINEECDTKEQVDILFTVDATGSMGDEIRYLQDELLDILKKIQSNKSISLHTGSVFYRDHGDEYITRISPLTSNIITTTEFISNQNAAGGGDGPEAVDDALIASIDQMNWRPSARTRILFLILDAPPHSASAHRERLSKAMQSAASKGIRIVPLVASGGGYEMDKSMEYLMRSLALATNGTYVFLTNHSGIGNHHTAPSTDSYKVETLNQILIRIVNQYSEAPGCREKDWQQITETIDDQELIIQQQPDQPEEKKITLECYPNPADNELWLSASDDMADVYISDNSGKLLEHIQLQSGKNRLDTSQYPSGVYFIKVLVGKTWLSKKFIVLHI